MFTNRWSILFLILYINSNEKVYKVGFAYKGEMLWNSEILIKRIQ